MRDYDAENMALQPQQPAPSGCRTTTLLKIVLVLVILNAVLCLGAAAYLWFLRSEAPAVALGTPVGARPSATAVPQQPNQTRAPGVGTALPTRPAGTPAAGTPAATRPPQQTAAPAAGTVLNDPSLQALFDAIANAPAGERVQANAGEAALSAEVVNSIGTNPTYQHESLQLRDGRITLTGRGTVQGISARIEVTVRPYTSDCRLVLEIERIRVGGLPAPRFLVDQATTAANQWSEDYMNAMNFCVDQLSVANGRLVLAGVVQ